MRWNKNGINSVLPLFIVEFDFIFIFINVDDCDWTQRNDKYALYVRALSTSSARVESVEYGAHRYCGTWVSCISELHHIISYQRWCISLFRDGALSLSRLHIEQYFESTHVCYTILLISIFSSWGLFQALFISTSIYLFLSLCRMNSSKFLVGKFMGNSSLFYYKISSHYWMDNKLKLKSNTLAA